MRTAFGVPTTGERLVVHARTGVNAHVHFTQPALTSTGQPLILAGSTSLSDLARSFGMSATMNASTMSSTHTILVAAENQSRGEPVASSLLAEYAETWRLLAAYDQERLQIPGDAQPSRGILDAEVANRAIREFKRRLISNREASSLFGRAPADALAGILGNIEQTMFGESLYKSREEKAAHILYFVVKDHPFSDGNKRIASLLFLLYLEQEGAVHQITPQALTALTLLVAESAPASKDLMIRLIVNLLVGSCG